MPTRRTRPLSIDDIPEQLAISASGVSVAPAGPSGTGTATVAGTGSEAHRHRLQEGLHQLRAGLAALRLNERILMVLGGVIAPTGLVIVLLGWYGASRTPYVFEQVPYLISGGLLGIGLVFVGAFLYFAHWMTEVVKEQRAQSTAVVDALRQLQEELGRRPAHAPTGAAVVAPLVATARGTMAHRPDCSVVAGKTGLRPVTPAEGLEPCRLCNPYADE